MSEEKPTLVIDFHEPFTKDQEFEALGYNIIRGNLGKDNKEGYPECGDYYFAHPNGEILVERKAMNDFDGSMSSGHLFDQAQRMREWAMEREDGKRYIYLKTIGNNAEYNTYAHVGVKGRVGGMMSIQNRYNIPVNNYSYYINKKDAEIKLPKEYGFNWACHKLFRSLSEGKFGEFRKSDLFKYTNPHNKKDFIDSRDFYIHCFRGIQGVSEVIAERIVDRLGIESFEDLTINLNYEALKTVPKVGPKIAQRIIEHWNVIL